MNGYWRKYRPVSALDDIPENAFSVMGDEALIDDQEVVDQLLEVLSDEERKLVVMKYHEGKRNVDIAKELGMNASTVSTKLAQALARMRAAAAGVRFADC